MATCSFLYHEGAKMLLQDPVKLAGSEEKDLALLRFVQAEDLSRCFYVRRLVIVMHTMPESVAQILADLVPRMTRLRQLNLDGDSERMFESYPYLLPMFAGLQSLKELGITGLGERCHTMIRTLQSQLVFAVIHFPPTHPLHPLDPNYSSAAASHPILTLEQSASTLEGLSCSCLFDTNQELSYFPPKVIYPRLHTLRLCTWFTLNPIPFIKAFPNLASLHLESTVRRLAIHSYPFYEFQRKMNLDLQQTSKYYQPCRWKRLREFRGHLVDLWILALTCPIDLLFLEDAPTLHPPIALADVLAYARPLGLTITFENHSLTDVLGGGFLSALRSDGASGLRSLAFVIDLMAVDSNLDIGQVLADLEFALAGLQLYDLLFAVRDIGLAEDTSTSPPAPTETPNAQNLPLSSSSLPACTPHSSPESTEDRTPLSLAERTLAEVNVLALAHRLMASIPTVQNLMIGIERPGRCGGGMNFACLSQQDDDHWLRACSPQSLNMNNYAELKPPHEGWRRDCAGMVKNWNKFQYSCRTATDVLRDVYIS